MTGKPKRKFYRRMAAFKVLGQTPDQRTWKQLKALLTTDELRAQHQRLTAALADKSGPEVMEIVTGEAAVTESPPKPKPAPGQAKRQSKPAKAPTKRNGTAEELEAGTRADLAAIAARMNGKQAA